ncbi:MAG: hypothetical protein KatS3mg108_1475 [Isosphaeraceae bacterium]|jgi:hypothetical protein|nr:MAG: hypothetical protein KatS3mg108_1475 [Isosphaeraceae bacterium]
MKARVQGVRRIGVMGMGLTLLAVVVPAWGQSAGPQTKGGAVVRALPRDTLAFFSIENAARLRASFQASQTGRLWDDPAMKPLRDKLSELLEKPNQELKEELGVTLWELLELPEGEMALAVLPSTSEKWPVDVVAVADAGKNADRMAALMKRVTELAEKEATVATEQADGLTLNIIQPKNAGEDAPPIIWAQRETWFGISTSADVLKALSAHSEGRTDSLLSNETYQKVVSKLGAAPAVFYVDVAAAIDLGVKAAGQGGIDADQIKAQLNLLGLSGLKAIGGMFDLNQGEFDSTSKLFIYAPNPRKGILKLFQFPAADLRPEPWVPAGVVSYATYSLDWEAMYAAAGELADQFAPGVLEQMEKALADQEGGLNIRADLLGPLAKRVTAIQDYKKPITETSQRMLIAIGLDDTKAMQATMNKILDLAGASPKKRTFQGETIYDFDLPDEARQGGLEGPLSVAIAKDQLFVSVEPTLLEQVLRGGGPSLAESADFEAVRKLMPERVNVMSFARPNEAVQALYGMLGGEQFKAALDQMRAQVPGEAPDFAQLFDPKLMPEYEAIQKYLAPSGSFGVPDEDGVTLTQFTLKARP